MVRYNILICSREHASIIFTHYIVMRLCSSGMLLHDLNAVAQAVGLHLFTALLSPFWFSGCAHGLWIVLAYVGVC